jgi:methyl-accepting chemotaxis protein
VVIKASIHSVQEYVTTTAGAVEEQSAVTREMSENMQLAAKAMETISGSVNEIARVTHEADSATKRVQEVICSLTD